ncbi:hypothetical protein P7D15_02460 [Bacillus cereus]|uniref:hypothetical protein n=1 Tax=Bacillus cereus TaxID=1396 RepID=UPI00240694EF|nr:hypothetical protein [Bacillus cereus]MDF9599283.1 hypothetical protein [Bacillus cereus]MDG1589614.1 hypothetical protein [Bacillus cereus]
MGLGTIIFLSLSIAFISFVLVFYFIYKMGSNSTPYCPNYVYAGLYISVAITFVAGIFPLFVLDMDGRKNVQDTIKKELSLNPSEYEIINKSENAYEVVTKDNRYGFYFKSNGKLLRIERKTDGESLRSEKYDKGSKEKSVTQIN